MKPLASLVPLAAMILTSASAWGSSPDNISALDDRGHKVHLERAPLRVVSLAPSITETVFALGLGDRVVGVSAHCDYPPAVEHLPRIGGFGSPDIERIVSLAPDIVLTTTVVQELVRRQLVSLGIPVYIVYPTTLEHLVDSTRRLGHMLGAEAAGERLAATLDARIERVRVRAAAIEPMAQMTVFLEIDSHPLFTATGSSFEGSLLRYAGGKNLAEAMDRDYSRIDQETVIAADPDVIITTHGRENAKTIEARRGWGHLSAVRNGRILTDLDPDLLVRPGPRAVDGLEVLVQHLYPAVVSDTQAPVAP